MNILHYDCFSGISGDMNLAAMIALGVDPDYLQSQLSKLGLDHEFELRVVEDAKNGIAGIRVDVVMKHAHHDPHSHRNLRDIERIIENSGLDSAVQQTGLAVFRKLAQAEAKVHGKDVYDIHFHEVGATDAIVDIVGAAICYHCLDIDQVWCSAIELGGGFVRCAHGRIPVPAPATVEILRGIPVTRGAVAHETTTPTGAAILAVLVDRFDGRPQLVADKTAYGIGHRDTDIPNVLRVQLARAGMGATGWNTLPARLLQCNIDDMSPEALAVIVDLFLQKGAQDVHFTPIVMKKNRCATSVSVLCAIEDENRFKRLLFQHTTTLGIKSVAIDKSFLHTRFEKIDTGLGAVTMKHALMDGAIIRSKPELEDCRRLAHEHDLTLNQVYERIGRDKQ